MKVQARITLPPDLRRHVDRLRAVWNPEKALGNPAHITVAYQDEAPDSALLAARFRWAVVRMPPFRLVVGTAQRFAEPTLGAFLAVADPSGGVAALRALVLAPPFTQRSRFGLHVTLLHPEQGERLEVAWPAFLQLPAVGSFSVTHLQLVGAANEILEDLALRGRPD